MAGDPIARLTAAAGAQDGALSLVQMREIGLSEHQARRLVARGILRRADHGVFVMSGAPETWQRRLRVLTLRVGPAAVVSHRSGARLWDLEGAEHQAVEVSTPRTVRRRPRVGLVHRSEDLVTGDVTGRHGFRVTNPTRTLVDLGAVVKEAQLEVALDDALRRGLTTIPRLLAAIERLTRPGRSGVPQLRALLTERGDIGGLTETGFETLLLRALRAHGLPLPTPQHPIHDDDGSFVMRVDAAYLDEKVALEADSKRWHGADARFESDREKRATAVSLGWHVLPFTYRQVSTRPGWVADVVDRALRAARRPAA